MERKTSGAEWLKDVRQWFCISVSILLCLTALAKIISIVQQRRFLDVQDGLFTQLATADTQFFTRVTVRDTLILAAILEISTALFMFVKRKRLSALVACIWLVATFAAYRMLWIIYYVKEPCHCLGGVLDWTGISPHVLAEVPVVLLWYFGGGSVAFLILSSFMPETLKNPMHEGFISNSLQGVSK